MSKIKELLSQAYNQLDEYNKESNSDTVKNIIFKQIQPKE